MLGMPTFTFRLLTHSGLEPRDDELDDLRSKLAGQNAFNVKSVDLVDEGAIEVVADVDAPDSLNGASLAFGALANALQETSIWVRTTYVKGTAIQKAKFADIDLVSVK